MNYIKLDNNISEVVKEEQIKLGYRKEVIRLYYPVQSVRRLLGTENTAVEIVRELKNYYEKNESILGRIETSCVDDRMCFVIPDTSVEFIHEHTENKEFIVEFIDTIRRHGCTIEELKKVFEKYSDKVHYEKTEHGEFDYLLYFEDGEPDDFRYCITDEGCHMIYHRFTIEDYEDFSF